MLTWEIVFVNQMASAITKIVICGCQHRRRISSRYVSQYNFCGWGKTCNAIHVLFRTVHRFFTDSKSSLGMSSRFGLVILLGKIQFCKAAECVLARRTVDCRIDFLTDFNFIVGIVLFSSLNCFSRSIPVNGSNTGNTYWMHRYCG